MQATEALADFLIGDVQRRHEAEHVGARLQHQQALRGGQVQYLARTAGVLRVEHGAQHQAAATHLREQAEFGVHRIQPLAQRGGLTRHVVGDLRRGQLAQRHARHRRGQRVAAEGGAMRAELHRLRDLGAGQHRTDREPAAQRLGQRHDVGHHAILPVREQRAGAAHAGLDLVQHQQCAVVVAQLAHRAQEAGRSRHHPALALHRFQHHRGHVAAGHGDLELGHIVEIDVAEAAGQGLVAFLVLGLRGGGDRGQRAAVEAAAEGHDDALIRRAALRCRPFAHQLDRGLVGLGAGVAQEHAFGEARGGDQFLGQSQRRFAVEHVAGVPELAGLLGECGHQIRIVVAQPAYGDARGQVQVFAALAVPDACTLAALQDHLARAVHRQVIALAVGQQVGGG